MTERLISTGRGYAVRHAMTGRGGTPPSPFVGGVVIGHVHVDDIHPAQGCCEPWGEETYPPANPEARPPGIVTHIVMSDPTPIEPPIPAKGKLGLWTPDHDLAFELEIAA